MDFVFRMMDFVTIAKGERFILASEANKLSKGARKRHERLLEKGAFSVI